MPGNLNVLPEDQGAQFGYAQCLLQLGRTDEADPVLVKAIELSPLSEIAELARTARSSIAQQSLRSAVNGGLRLDAVMFCLDALQKFHDLGDAKTRSVAYEISMLGRGGLDINDPSKKYSLRSLPGTFSALRLVSFMYTGLQLIDPSLDAGIDLSREFSMAKELLDTPDGPAGS